MCMMPKMPKMPEASPASRLIAAPTNAAAIREGDAVARLRRARAGAAADILTSPVGIPAATDTLGGVAR